MCVVILVLVVLRVVFPFHSESRNGAVHKLTCRVFYNEFILTVIIVLYFFVFTYFMIKLFIYFMIYLLFYVIYLLLISLDYELGLLEALFNYLLLSFNISSLHASLTDYEYFKYVCYNVFYAPLNGNVSGYTALYQKKLLL